nr:sialidase family protein [Pyrinomonadaceae bacterium]
MKVLLNNLNKWTIVSAIIAIVSVAAIILVFGFPAYFFDFFSDKTKKKQSRADNLRGALEYEFNMTKDPALNAIPEGIREKEIEQADSIVREQLRNNANLLGTYSYVGPENLGGRTRALAYDLRYNGTTNRIILAGGISGGLFKSYDDGAGWVRKSPSGDLFTVSALAQDSRPGFQDIWYYAGGEFTGNSASATGAPYRGKGVFKSTDNGETWTFLPSSNTGVLESFDHPADYVQKIVVSPTTGFVYLAALNTIYRSPDGGTTWSVVLTSGIPTFGTSMPTDIVVAPDGSFYAAFAGFSPSPMPGVWRSPSGDLGTWTKIAGAGAPTSPAGWNADGTYGRVVLALAP